MRRPPLTTILLLAAWTLGAARSVSAQTAVIVDSAVAIPMRDGVVLRAEIWRPKAEGRFPVLVYRTPYDRRDAADDSGVARQAVSRGYVVVLEDVRGRYGSDGEFVAYMQEGKDGYDTIEWAAKQPWSDGSVGTFGLSYPGAVQWLAAVERPPSLRAMVPAMTYATPETFWYSGGVWDGSWLDWTWFNIAPDLRRRLDVAGPRTSDEAASVWKTDQDRLRSHRPLSTLPDFQGVAPWYYEWMRHPPGDPWWRWATLAGKYDSVSAAVLNISGWFDEPYGPFGATTNFNGLKMSRETRDSRVIGPGVSPGQSTHLILGAWTHGVGAVQRNRAGRRSFGVDGGIDYAETVLRWMDRYVRGIQNGVDSEPAVKVYVMGADRWRTSDRWPIGGTTIDTLYLGGSSDSLSNGVLAPRRAPAGRGTSTIHSDPEHPLADPHEGAAGAYDYAALVRRPELAIFETGKFATPLEIVGPIVAELEVSATVPDFDVWVQAYDVGPDGVVWNITAPGSGLVRASYRDGGPDRKLVGSGQIVSLRIDRLFTANRFLSGHRLRIVVSTAFAPWFSVNPQTGDLELTSTGTRAGDVMIHHSSKHVSRVLLPVVH